MAYEIGIPYTLVGPTGRRVVFNDRSDPDFVGFLDAEDGISGLDSADVRDVGDTLVGADGGVNGRNFYGRRPVVIKGMIAPEGGIGAVNTRGDNVLEAADAMSADALLTWTQTGREPTQLLLRRSQPPRLTGRLPKKFTLPLISDYDRIVGTAEQSVVIAPPPPELVSNGSFEGGTTAGWGTGDGLYITAGAVLTSVLDPLAASGARSMRVAVPASSSRGACYDLLLVANQPYAIQLVLRSDGVNAVSAKIGQLFGSFVDTFIASAHTSATMTRYTLIYTPTADGVHRLYIRNGAAVAFNFFVDAVSIRNSGTVAPYEDVIAGGFSSPLTSPLTSVVTALTAQPVTTSGRVGAHWRARIDGPVTNPAIVNLDTGERVQINYTLGVGEWLDLETRPGRRSLKLNGVSNRWGAIDFSQTTFFELALGTTQIQTQAFSSGPGSLVTLYWRNSYRS